MAMTAKVAGSPDVHELDGNGNPRCGVKGKVYRVGSGEATHECKRPIRKKAPAKKK